LDLSVVYDDEDEDANGIPWDKYDIMWQVPESNLGRDTDRQAPQMWRKFEFKTGTSA